LAILMPVAIAGCAGGPSSGYYPGGAPAPGARPAVGVGANDPPPHPLARSASYTCEDLTTVVLTEGQPFAQVTFNSGLVLTLAHHSGGQRYGAPPYEFLARGGEGTMLNNNKAVRCRAK
jgi:membrane-bound inhibitor of C-type lysozyme